MFNLIVTSYDIDYKDVLATILEMLLLTPDLHSRQSCNINISAPGDDWKIAVIDQYLNSCYWRMGFHCKILEIE